MLTLTGALIVIEPVAVVVPAANIRALLSSVPVMAALIAMLLSAFRVSVVGVAHVIVCDTVMLPSSAPPPPVLITTFSVASAVWIVVLAIVAGAALPVNVAVPPAVIEPVLLSAAVISMLKGSSSQGPQDTHGRPDIDAGATADAEHRARRLDEAAVAALRAALGGSAPPSVVAALDSTTTPRRRPCRRRWR